MKSIRRENTDLVPANSEEFNAIFNDVVDDMQELYATSAELSVKETNIIDLLSKENMFLYNKLQALYNEVANIQTAVDNIVGDTPVRTYYKRFTSLDDVSGYSNAAIDIFSRSATISGTGKKISRTHIYDKALDELYVPSDLEIRVTESLTTTFSDTPTVTSISDKTLFNMINEDNSTYWTREKARVSTENILYLKVELILPLEFSNTLASNAIDVSPFPGYSMSIYKAEYKNDLGQTVVLFNEEHKTIPTITIPFDTANVTSVCLYFKQIPVFCDNEWKFIYGFRNLDVTYTETITSSGSFIVTVDTPAGLFLRINYPETEYAEYYKKPTESLVTYHLYYDDSFTNEMNFGEQILANISRVYIKVVINKSSLTDSAPVISGFNLEYITK